MTATMLEKDVPSEPSKSILTGRYRIPTVGIVLVVTLLAFEAMAVGTVMPVTARELHGLSLYAWVFSAFLIASLLANVVAGGWADRTGPGRPLMAGLVTFVTGLVIAGTAPAMWVFVAGRAVQGLGAGAAGVAIYVLVARVYPEHLRPRAFFALSAAWVVPSLVGPALAGLVAEHFHWRGVFLGLIPLVVPAMVMLIPSLRDAGGGSDELSAGASRGGARAVWPARGAAAVALAGGAGALLFAIDHPALPMLPVAALGLAGLAFGLPRLLPPGALVLRRGVPAAVTMRGLMSGAFFATEAFIPLALTSAHGFTPTQAGVVLTFGALGWSASSWVQGRMDRPHRSLIVLGGVLTAIGVAGIAIGTPVYAWSAVPSWIIAGSGMGLTYGGLSVLVLNLSAPLDQGTNSAALQISDTLGGALGIGLAGALVTGFGADRLGPGLAAAGALTMLIAAVAVVAALRVRDGREALDA
ncbi:MFS transporter [Actinomadura sp. HBU206391]|uniref:MFS transporter n=1 Tax=Actinomadura sp. HBU206391 TaxID=2731692 RepID=UPI00164EF0F8|nr:MFS transporter [Actinomadura sp. HBU206391]MBC6459564.1 MFS transporter [Actinomadura sp. HBU206391]